MKKQTIYTDRISGNFDDVLEVKFFIVDVHFEQIVFDSALVVWIKV